MKKLLVFLFIPFLIAGCGGNYQSTNVDTPRLTGEIGAFNLTSPANDYRTNTGFTFTWEEATNAEYYTIEICAEETFYNDKDAIYVKENNLYQAKYDLNYTLPVKDITYYWRVTANNKDHTKLSNTIGQFFYESKKVKDIPIEIEDAQDWAVHKQGSPANVSIDRNDFFGNGKNSLVISFTKEDTSVNHNAPDVPISSVGWLVITKTEDRELYGTDAFYLNFYYSGHDSNIFLRVLDYDGEYWHQQIQIANGSKQTIILKYEDFQLRTNGSNVFNRKFDWQHIRYFEIVFEKTFGDGVCVLSDIKAVNFEDYSYMFMSKMNFSEHPVENWTYNNYDFIKTISEDGNELTLGYTTPFPGYGFQSVDLYKYFVNGDTIRFKIKYTGTYSTAVFYFRIYEEDKDTWQYKVPFSYLTKDAYKEITIPLAAFQRMSTSNGDGAKQFYFVQKFIIGLAENYSAGSISIKDLELVKLSDVYESTTKVVNELGRIEDFNEYGVYTDIYQFWKQSVNNKDEQINLDNVSKAGGFRNINCGEFAYKADMEAAQYGVEIDSSLAKEKNAFQIWLKDVSKKPESAAYKDKDVAAHMTIQLKLETGELYNYLIEGVKHEWNVYTIPFSKFELVNRTEILNPQEIKSDKVVRLGLAFQFFYRDLGGQPTYIDYNLVYVDEMYFVTADDYSEKEISSTIYPDNPESPDITTIDTFEGVTQYDIEDYWKAMKDLETNEFVLSDEVSSQGGSTSLKMHYKGDEANKYYRTVSFSKEVVAKGLEIDIKGDGKASIRFDIYYREGTNLYTFRYTIQPSSLGSSDDWYTAKLGFAKFTDSSSKYVSSDTAKNIEGFSFEIINSDGSEGDIYIDNFKMMLNDIKYSTATFTPIA